MKQEREFVELKGKDKKLFDNLLRIEEQENKPVQFPISVLTRVYSNAFNAKGFLTGRIAIERASFVELIGTQVRVTITPLDVRGD